MILPAADIVIVCLILLSAVIGLARGLVKELVSLVIWVCAIAGAMLLAPLLADHLSAAIEASRPIRVVIAFLAVFFGVLIAGGLSQWSLAKLIQSTGLSGTDRFLGFMFGALRGGLVVVAGLILMRPFAETSVWWDESLLRPELLVFEDDILRLFRLTGAEPADLGSLDAGTRERGSMEI
ncbi:MAG: CvpA family protein [Gammaproteobacteria bacterium]|nr:CvpA family protein [Gammaproteobacteria bacterium]